MVNGSLADARRQGIRLRFWIAMMLAIALSLFVTFNISNASADTTTNVVVHSGDVGTSWYSGPPATTRSGGSVSFVSGPATAPLGSGSLQLNTTDANGASNAKAQLFNYSYEGTALTDLSALSFSEYHSSASSPANPDERASINIEITDPVLGFTTLVYEPYEQGVTLSDNTWEPWNTLDGQWWSTKQILPGNTTTFQTAPWSTILSVYPHATITGGVGFNVGSNWPGTTVNNADALSITASGATTVYDFEPTPVNNVVMSVQDSSGNPISGAAITYQGGSYLSLGTTDSTGTVSAHLSPGTYSFYASYHGTRSAAFGPVSVTNDAVTTNTFQTIKAQVNLQTCDGTGVAGGQARYTNGSTYYFGGPMDANGVATYEIFPGTYDVEMDFTNAAVHQTVDFTTTSSVTFNTVPVTLLNSGSIRYQNANGGSIAYYNGPTMQMLPGSYKFEASGTWFTVDAPAGCSGTPGFTGGVVRLVDHNGNGLAGGSVSVYSGGWSQNVGTTDSDGNYAFSAPTSVGLSIGMTYKGMYNQQSIAQLTASHFTFQTVLTTLKLNDADGNGLAGGNALENAYYPLGTTDGSGIITAELLPGNYTFAMGYNGTRQNISQNNGTNPVVTFQTGRVTLYYSDSAMFSNSQFYPFTKPSMEFLPGTISINVGGTAGKCQAPLNIAAGDHIVKSAVVAVLSNHAGARVAGGVASAYVGGHWVTFDATTNGAGIACQLFDGQLGNVSVAMVYGGTRQQITQNQPTNSVYAFQTGQVTIELKDSTGTLIDTGAASYYAGGWHDLGNTTNGKLTVDVLPGSYSFAMVYNGERQQLNGQAVTNGSTVVFQTVKANVQLLNSTGAGIEGGDASYYAGGWHTFGTTDASGNAYQEMLPGSYSFAMVFEGERQQLNGQDVSSPIHFQTVLATVTLTSSTGTGLADGDVSYYAGGWHSFGTTDANGQAMREMLPGSYSFAMVYQGGRQQLTGQDVANTIAYQTGQVYSDSGNATSYYAGGWHTFTQDMELLPGSYPFHFNDGTPQTNVTVTGGSINHIH